MRTAKQNYLNKKCVDAKGDSGKMWKVIRQATNDRPKPNITPDFVWTKSTDGNPKKTRKQKGNCKRNE